MAKRATKKKAAPKKGGLMRRVTGWVAGMSVIRAVWWWASRTVLVLAVLMVLTIALFGFVRPPTTPYIIAERLRLGGINRDWVAMEDIAPVMARSVVAAEDANFCLHWGFDMAAIRDVIAEGSARGASTLSQQVAKNVFLWHGRSWPRKAMEAAVTPVIELFWSKRRIVEVYLNVAEFDEGVFGVAAASRHYFGVEPDKLTARQAALLAAVLPNPKERSAGNPSTFVSERAKDIADGAATIQADGRAGCFQSRA